MFAMTAVLIHYISKASQLISLFYRFKGPWSMQVRRRQITAFGTYQFLNFFDEAWSVINVYFLSDSFFVTASFV